MLLARIQKATNAGHLAAVGVALAAATLLTWPLARDAWDHVLAAAYYWDAYTNAMILGCRVDAVLGRAPLSLYDNYFFAPLPDSIVFNENHFGLSLLFAPLYLATENPLWAYNGTLLLSLCMSVFFTYLLVRRLTGSGYAGIVSGVAFAFCPYVLFEIGRIQLVATQWIPACFLLLHRAIEERRLRDVLGFWLCYVLQIGTCLYYAMFLLPLLGLVGVTLLVRQRPPRILYFRLAALGAVAGAVAFAMVHPYFTARDSFFLERSPAFASSYDGELSFFGNVHPTNLTLTALHHVAEQRGAHEEIAFPGFTVLALLAVSLVGSLWPTARGLGAVALTVGIARWLGLVGIAGLATLVAKSALVGVLVLGLGVWWQTRVRATTPFSGERGLYLALLFLAVAMFLGLELTRLGDTPVHGLYYYFHTYFPGFNGIRKVSRQAVMTTFVFTVLAGFGNAWLLGKLKRQWAKVLVTSGLLLLTCFELRSFPHAMQSVWAGRDVPAVYGFLSKLPPDELIAVLPQNAGQRRFRGDAGLALHNYLALYHRHRFVNGQSSWQPPVTELVRRASRLLPDAGARRALLSVGVDHLLIHGDDLDEYQRPLPERLMAEPQHYRLVYESGGDKVFSLLPADEPLELLEVPRLPASAVVVPWQDLRATASHGARAAALGIDGNQTTFWSGKLQAKGHYFELQLKEPRRVVALEIENNQRTMDVPLSFELAVGQGTADLVTVAKQPTQRLFREQIYSPKTFVFRVVFSNPTQTERVRITVDQPVPGHEFSVQEARVYAEP
jgi:hypothetical protein